jgi:hypothetical protein
MLNIRLLGLKITFYSWIIITSLSCSNEFEITEPPTDIAIVYALMTSTDTANYFRIERAFIDENTSALTLSKDPDKLYWNNENITLTNTRTNRTYTLTKVDGNTEGYKRDPGVFADAPNYLYKLPSSVHLPIAGDKYLLKISQDDRTIASANTAMLPNYNDFDLYNPSSSSLLNFSYKTDFNFEWSSPADAVIHDIDLVFNYKEVKSGVTSNKSITWHVKRNYSKLNPSDVTNSVKIMGESFYIWLKANIPEDPQVKRFVTSADIILTSGGPEILNYLTVGQANLGITSSGEIPVYSNIQNGGRGIFSSKTRLVRKNIIFSPVTQDSIQNGVYTKKLNFL